MHACRSTLEDPTRRKVALGTLLLLPAAAALSLAPRLADDRAIYTGQSLYASLRVVDSEWYDGVPARELWQNGSLSSVEHRVTGEPLHHYQITLGWLLQDRIQRIGKVLVLGGAAQTFPAELQRWAPHVRTTVVEIDPMSVRVAREFFSFGRLPPGSIDVVVQDARPFLARDLGTYDVILLDAYDHLYSVPWPLMTREAFGDVEARLAPGGMVGLTVSTPLEGPGAAFLGRLVATLETTFEEVRVYPSRPEEAPSATQEVIVVALRGEADAPTAGRPWVRVEGEGAPFRDDYAPVEFLQAVRFLFDPAW